MRVCSLFVHKTERERERERECLRKIEEKECESVCVNVSACMFADCT